MKNKIEEEIKIEGWAVLFTPEIIESMVATDNGKLFSPLCIFKTPSEAVCWMDEKWMGGADLKLICRVQITVPKKKFKP